MLCAHAPNTCENVTFVLKLLFRVVKKWCIVLFIHTQYVVQNMGYKKINGTLISSYIYSYRDDINHIMSKIDTKYRHSSSSFYAKTLEDTEKHCLILLFLTSTPVSLCILCSLSPIKKIRNILRTKNQKIHIFKKVHQILFAICSFRSFGNENKNYYHQKYDNQQQICFGKKPVFFCLSFSSKKMPP